MRQVYLDNAATTALRPEVAQRMSDVLLNIFGNPSSTHLYGREAKTIMETARKTIAAQLGVSGSEIIFTSGGTEADNLCIISCARDLGVDRIITSRIEHHAVGHAVEYCAHHFGTQIDYVDLQDCGTPSISHLEVLLSQKSSRTLVSLMHVNNEVGNITDIAEVARLCKKYDALLHSDCVQSIGHYDLNLAEIPIDFVAASAHKFHGPKGVGFAFLRKGSKLRSLIVGGGQERGYRAGTESVHNVAGMELAFKMAYENLEKDREHIVGLKNYMKEQLRTHLPGVEFNGNCANNEMSTYTLLNVTIPCTEAQSLMMLFQLDMKGIACSKGSACQSGSDLGSHVINSIKKDVDHRPSLRFSFSIFNTKEDIDYTIEVLKELAKPS